MQRRDPAKAIREYEAIYRSLYNAPSQEFEVDVFMPDCHPSPESMEPFQSLWVENRFKAIFRDPWMRLKAALLAINLAWSWIPREERAENRNTIEAITKLLPRLNAMVDGNYNAIQPGDPNLEVILRNPGNMIPNTPWYITLAETLKAVFKGTIAYFQEEKIPVISSLYRLGAKIPGAITPVSVPQTAALAWQQSITDLYIDPNEAGQIRMQFYERWMELIVCQFPVVGVESMEIEEPTPNVMGEEWIIQQAIKEGRREIRERIGDAYQSGEYEKLIPEGADQEDIYYVLQEDRDKYMRELETKYDLLGPEFFTSEPSERVFLAIDEEVADIAEEIEEDYQ